MQVVGKEGALKGGGGRRALGEGFAIRVVLGLGDGVSVLALPNVNEHR